MTRPCILIVGGAGYIGSHANLHLHQNGYDTVVLDNLVYGHEAFVQWGCFEHADLADKDAIRRVFSRHRIDAVLHFAAFAYVGESVSDPGKYYRNNVANSLNLLEVMREVGVDDIVFSSTCATYGVPQHMPLTEQHPQAPINPYGHSKLMVERILLDHAAAYGMHAAILRYFNAAGADPEGRIGEEHDPETHLIPLAIQAALDPQSPLKVFGDDYPTTDGTCIRDYIHVCDLASAHQLALEWIQREQDNLIINLGNGQGYSVRQVIDSVERVSGRSVPHHIETRRAGDPPVLIGSAKHALELGWQPRYTELDTIIGTAWQWHCR